MIISGRNRFSKQKTQPSAFYLGNFEYTREKGNVKTREL